MDSNMQSTATNISGLQNSQPQQQFQKKPNSGKIYLLIGILVVIAALIVVVGYKGNSSGAKKPIASNNTNSLSNNSSSFQTNGSVNIQSFASLDQYVNQRFDSYDLLTLNYTSNFTYINNGKESSKQSDRLSIVKYYKNITIYSYDNKSKLAAIYVYPENGNSYICYPIGMNYSCNALNQQFDFLHKLIIGQNFSMSKIGQGSFLGQQCVAYSGSVVNTTQYTGSTIFNFTSCISNQYGIPLNMTLIGNSAGFESTGVYDLSSMRFVGEKPAIPGHINNSTP